MQTLFENVSRRNPSPNRNSNKQSLAAFTWIELVVVLALLAILMVPLAAHQRSLSTRSEQLVCLANLRHIGHAFQVWAGEHNDQNPFLVEQSDGGIRGHPIANNLWFQFAWISNELVTPRVLVCPSDTNTPRVARDFSNRADGGLLNPSYRNNALSYFLSFHAFRDNPGALLAGDRNVRVTGSSACSYAGLSVVSSIQFPSGDLWTNFIHGTQGNLLFNDGQAQTTSSLDFRNVLNSPSTDAQRIHLITPH